MLSNKVPKENAYFCPEELGDLQVFWNKSMRMGYCTWDIGDGSKPSLHILDLMMWLVGVWKDLG